MKSLVVFFVFLSTSLYGLENDKGEHLMATFAPMSQNKSTEQSWFPWWGSSSSDENENSIPALVKKTRQAAYEYYVENDGAATNMVSLSQLKTMNAHFGDGMDFQLIIVSLYDGKRYYEGISQACIANDRYSPSEKAWGDMAEQAKRMAALSYDMVND